MRYVLAAVRGGWPSSKRLGQIGQGIDPSETISRVDVDQVVFSNPLPCDLRGLALEGRILPGSACAEAIARHNVFAAEQELRPP